MIVLLVTLIIFVSIHRSFELLSLKDCPVERIQFEKIIGLRPVINDTDLLSPLIESIGNEHRVPTTKECFDKCNTLENCDNFLIFYNNNTCAYWPNNVSIVAYDIDANHIDWFRKICLYSPREHNLLWTFETVLGATLLDNQTKPIENHMTREDCQRQCMQETEFQCKSITFILNQTDAIVDDPNQQGFCTLSNSNRFLSNSYRPARFNEQYSEKLCSNQSGFNKNIIEEFCAYNRHSHSVMTKNDAYFSGKSAIECEKLCEDSKYFPCRSYSLRKLENSTEFHCYLSSTDSKVLGPRIISDDFESEYFEKAPCLNIHVHCNTTGLMIKYRPKDVNFVQIYMSGHSEKPGCFARQTPSQHYLFLNLTFSPNRCGFLLAKSPQNREFWTATLNIQYHPLIQTSSDRTIKIGCILGNSSRILVGTGVNVTDNVLESKKPLVSSAGSAPMVKVEMHVIDARTGQEVGNTHLGQDLQLIIEAQNLPKSMDIWARRLIAMTENHEESLMLLNDMSCPTDEKVFPKLSAIYNGTVKQLVAPFQAFKFSTSSVVRFSVMVELCRGMCPQINCSNTSVRRRRGDSNASADLVSPMRTNNSIGILQPIQYIMLVKNLENIPENLVFNKHEHSITSDNVCVNYELSIAIITLWILIQIAILCTCGCLVRHYQKRYDYTKRQLRYHSAEILNRNFDFGTTNPYENCRRVHWADTIDDREQIFQ